MEFVKKNVMMPFMPVKEFVLSVIELALHAQEEIETTVQDA